LINTRKGGGGSNCSFWRGREDLDRRIVLLAVRGLNEREILSEPHCHILLISILRAAVARCPAGGSSENAPVIQSVKGPSGRSGVSRSRVCSHCWPAEKTLIEIS